MIVRDYENRQGKHLKRIEGEEENKENKEINTKEEGKKDQ